MKMPETFMREALKEAAAAGRAGEVPVGAVVVRGGEIIGRGRNRTESGKDPTAHAEMEAVRAAARAVGDWRLSGCSVYVTAEPCAMCAGALVLARIDRLYVGTENPKAGACVSLYRLLQDERLNHQAEVETGLLREECEALMKSFFEKLRGGRRQPQEGR
ncbi:MAG: nucleoside deaminase [Clostridiales Family XIII bacterium]|jgi:tRNA(adenine34) deaminase|nr:nucleoside deaminase [Clostridiales Family XIII bacterium]